MAASKNGGFAGKLKLTVQYSPHLASLIRYTFMDDGIEQS